MICYKNNRENQLKSESKKFWGHGKCENKIVC